MPSVGVVGAGLIGGSVALRAAELGWTVGVYDSSAERCRIALERLGATFATESLGSLAARCETLVLAAPLDVTLAHLAELESDLPGCVELVVDVASVKRSVALAGARVRAFVPTHPIAGSERNGPEAARADLFADRVWAFEPAVSAPSRERATRFIEAMGALPIAIDSGEHDRIVAFTSHLPQIVSVALAAQLEASLAEPNALDLSGTGLRSMLRLAGSSWTVWRAVLRENARPLAQEVRRLADILSGVAEALENDVPGVLERRFAEAAIVAARLDSKVPAANGVVSASLRNTDQSSDER